MTFDELVLGWVKTKDSSAVRLVSVSGCGTDWAGSTEAGFYDRFTVEITYEWADGRRQYRDAQGEDMQSLWEHVVKAWPSPVQ